MIPNPEHGGADRPYRSLLNQLRRTGRYRLLDRNSDPELYLPAIPDAASVNRHRDPYRTKGTS